MIQREQRHVAGRFRVCDGCGREPRHILSRGRTNSEPALKPGQAERHSLECACRSTARHPSLEQAESEWGPKWTQGVLTLPVRRSRGVA